MSVSQITPTLFLGGADAPLNASLVSQKGITLIVNATLSHASPMYPGVECVRVPVPDAPTARLGDHFERVAQRIHGNKCGGTLVHCAMGMSRSPALVMAYLMRYRGVTLRQAHQWVRDIRPHVRLNAGFWDQLLRYEMTLYGKNTVKVAPQEEEQTTTTTRPKLTTTMLPLTPLTQRSMRLTQPLAHTLHGLTQPLTHTLRGLTQPLAHTLHAGLAQVPKSPVLLRSNVGMMTPQSRRRRAIRRQQH